MCRSAGKATLILLVPLLATAVYVHLLRLLGELLSAKTLAAMSVSSEKIVWLHGYYDSGFLHKVDIAQLIGPRVAVVGSSRSMQIRAHFFNKLPPQSFYNLGGCCRSIVDVQQSVRALLADETRRPALLLLGLDSWWFQSQTNTQTHNIRWVDRYANLATEQLGRLPAWLSNETDRLQVLQQAWRDPRFQTATAHYSTPAYDTVTGARLVGVSARANNSGFRNDGSFRYGKLIETEEAASERAHALDSAAVVEIGSRGRTRGGYLVEKNLRVFESILNETSRAGIRIIVFSPPFAPAGLDYIASLADSRDFIARYSAAIAAICERRGTAFFDATDGRVVSATNQDFYDWAHPSERLMARLFLRIYRDKKAGSALTPYGDVRELETDLTNGVGRWQVYTF